MKSISTFCLCKKLQSFLFGQRWLSCFVWYADEVYIIFLAHSLTSQEAFYSLYHYFAVYFSLIWQALFFVELSNHFLKRLFLPVLLATAQDLNVLLGWHFYHLSVKIFHFLFYSVHVLCSLGSSTHLFLVFVFVLNYLWEMHLTDHWVRLSDASRWFVNFIGLADTVPHSPSKLYFSRKRC